MTPQRKTQVCMTAGSLALVGAHLFWPDLRFDGIAMMLFAVAAIPWLLPLFKSVELPGGLKFEFQALQDAEKRAVEAGLLDEHPEPAPSQKYSFQVIADEDANLALVGLRIEIERCLGRLAEAAGVGTARLGVSRLLRLLGEEGILTREERGVLADLVGLLNSAAHGRTADQRSVQWALEVGTRLLATLEKRIERQQPC